MTIVDPQPMHGFEVTKCRLSNIGIIVFSYYYSLIVLVRDKTDIEC